jgi:manganese/zinc-transporting P-type ATPase C
MAVSTKSRSANKISRKDPIIRIAPGAEGVSIWSAALFADPAGPNSRQFLARAFSVEEVASVEIRREEAFGRIYYQSTAEAPGIWRKLSQALQSLGSRGRAPKIDDEFVEPKGVDGLFLEGPSTQPIRVHRVGLSLSTWRLRYESKTRVRLSHPILLNRKDVAYRLEEELAAILGVTDFRTSVLTSSVVVHLDPRQLNLQRLIRRLEVSWPKLLEGLEGPPSSKKFAAAVSLLGLAYTGQYLVPALKPLAILGVAAYGFPNVANGAKQLVRGQIGLPALYSAGLTFMLISGMPFSSTVMAVLMQLWPRLAYGTMTKSQRRLFAVHRQRTTWARVLQDDGIELEVDIDTLSAGDLVTVQEGEVVPVDGIITEGLAAIDEEALSGTAGAQDKTTGDVVYAATFVRAGRIIVRVEKVGPDTVAGIIGAQLPHGKLELPSSVEAETSANTMAKPALVLAGVSLFTTQLMRPSQAYIRPDYATGPRLSAQLAALHDIGDALHQGILFRDPAAIDRIIATDVYVFDDSAALERRQLKVGEILAVAGISQNIVLGYATAAFPVFQNERARALSAKSAEADAAIPQIFNRVRKAGAISYRDAEGHHLEIAAPAYIEEKGIRVPASITDGLAAAAIDRRKSEPHEEVSLRPLYVLRDDKVLGAVTFHCQGEWEGKEIIATLQKRNKRARFVYLSSHAQVRAEAIAAKIGIMSVFGELDAKEKARAVEKLGRRTIWLGDGSIADSLPSIEASTVSVSLAGVTSLATDAANIVLFQASLRGIVPLRRLGRGHRARIESAYRATYTANLLAVAGGFFGGFGSLESGLTSNIGTGYVYSSYRRLLGQLIARVEARQARLRLPANEESDPHTAATRTNASDVEHHPSLQNLEATSPLEEQSEGV